MTSSDVVRIVRKKLGLRAVGHMGTLDPIGEGVLLIGVGKGTRLFDYYLNKTKTYETVFTFGYETDTLDVTGKTERKTLRIPTEEEIETGCGNLTGVIKQIPPSYSAKSVGGVRAYSLARKGLTPELKAAEVTVSEFSLIEKLPDNGYKFRIDCSSGTYVRSLCRDLARSVGSLASMRSIKRTRAGKYLISDSISIDEISWDKVIPIESALSELPKVELPDSFYKKIVNGVPAEYPTDYERFLLYCGGEFFGIGAHSNGSVRVVTYLREEKTDD